MKATQNNTATKKATTTKVVESNKLTAFDKKMLRLEALKQKQQNEGLNLAELKSLVNTLLMLEDKKPSAVYNKLARAKSGEIADNVKLILGKSKMPMYAEFVTELTRKPKAMYSVWDGINVLAKFNKLAVTKTKVEAQNKKTAAI